MVGKSNTAGCNLLALESEARSGLPEVVGVAKDRRPLGGAPGKIEELLMQMEHGFCERNSFVCSFPVGLKRLIIVWML